MELIPVLSTIILVATITTFILAIGAYILYKRREKRGQRYTPVYTHPVSGEFITPGTPEVRRGKVREEVMSEKVTLTETPGTGERMQVKAVKERKKTEQQQQTTEKFLKYTSGGYTSTKENNERDSLKWR
jgi:hypothetical protein